MSGGFAHSGAQVSTTNGQLASSLASGSSGAASSSLSQRVADFVEKNKRALAITAGASIVIVGGAAGYYYYRGSSSQSGRPSSSSKGKSDDSEVDEAGSPTAGNDEGAAAARKKTKKKKSKKSSASTTTTTTAAPGSASVEADGDSEGSSDDALKLSSHELAAMPIEKRKQIAGELKTRGNKAYSAKKYKEAIDIYSKAIECDEQAVYFSNRAACYTNLGKHEEVVKDCTEALRLDPTYVKALNRRGQARESLGKEDNLFAALCDFTAGAIIDGFQNESMAKAVDRVMKQYATEKGSKIMSEREPRLPSPTFIKAYMEAFREQERPTRSDSPSQGEETMFLAFDALDARNYTHAFTLFNESIEQNIEDKKLKGRALNMLGTFKFIIGDAPGALEALDESSKLCPEFTQTWVKKASVYMELSRPEQAFESFEEAIKINDKDPDIYYHRGQVYFITGQFHAAIEEYKRSTELDNKFVFSQIQLAVALYKNEQAERALHLFKKIIKEFGTESPEVYNYYGEILLDRGEFTSALENLDKAISLEKAKGSTDSAPVNVLPMVNKALCLYQSRQALDEAETICNEALELDPSCDIAVATLGQLLLQQNKVKEAVKAFEKSAEIARTEPELVNALAYEAATKAQLDFIQKYPEYAHKLGLAQSRM